jgi:hypothetical protein
MLDSSFSYNVLGYVYSPPLDSSLVVDSRVPVWRRVGRVRGHRIHRDSVAGRVFSSELWASSVLGFRSLLACWCFSNTSRKRATPACRKHDSDDYNPLHRAKSPNPTMTTPTSRFTWRMRDLLNRVRKWLTPVLNANHQSADPRKTPQTSTVASR